MDDLGFDISRRRVTVSTSGLVPQMLQARRRDATARWRFRCTRRTIACATSSCRSIASIRSPSCWMRAGSTSNKQNARSITFEYVMLDGINDQPEHAHELVQAAAGPAGEVNLIPFNPFPQTRYKRSRSGDRTLPRHPESQRRDRDDASHARRRHRCGLRPARRSRERSHDGSSGLEAHLSGGATVKRDASVRGARPRWHWLRCVGCGCMNTSNKSRSRSPNARRKSIWNSASTPAQGQSARRPRKKSIARSSRTRAMPRRSLAAGLLYDRLGEAKKADSHFDRAVSLDPKNPEIENNYAAFCASSERYERGEKLRWKRPTNPLYNTPEVAFLNAGNCARAAGRFEARGRELSQGARGAGRSSARRCSQMADLEYEQTGLFVGPRVSRSATWRSVAPIRRRCGWACASSAGSATRLPRSTTRSA